MLLGLVFFPVYIQTLVVAVEVVVLETIIIMHFLIWNSVLMLFLVLLLIKN